MPAGVSRSGKHRLAAETGPFSAVEPHPAIAFRRENGFARRDSSPATLLRSGSSPRPARSSARSRFRLTAAIRLSCPRTDRPLEFPATARCEHPPALAPAKWSVLISVVAGARSVCRSSHESAPNFGPFERKRAPFFSNQRSARARRALPPLRNPCSRSAKCAGDRRQLLAQRRRLQALVAETGACTLPFSSTPSGNFAERQNSGSAKLLGQLLFGGLWHRLQLRIGGSFSSATSAISLLAARPPSVPFGLSWRRPIFFSSRALAPVPSPAPIGQ